MNQLFRELLTLLFPARVDAQIVRTLPDSGLLDLYHVRATGEIITLLPFQNPHVRACIHETKFHQNERAIKLLGTVLNRYLKTQPGAIIIPVPLSRERLRERGYNQVELIAQAAVHDTRSSPETEILYRQKHTTPQTKLSRADRLINMQDAFAAYKLEAVRNKIVGAHIIVVDDVTTTGATLNAARREIEKYNPDTVTCVALAH